MNMVETISLPEDTVRLPAERIHEFIYRVFAAAGFLPTHARRCADVLTSADLRGIRSHGVARLPKFLNLIRQGQINLAPKMSFRAGSPTTGIYDADNGSGIVASTLAMEKAMVLAEEYGTGFVAVKNTSHFGYPGYYVQQAMKKGLIGICMSNGDRIVTPTFAIEPFMGSNPMSFGIPGGPDSHDFYLDMATAVVARGKIETYLREKKPVPKGWTPESLGPLELDENGILSFDTPLLPLGGENIETGSHKGYALSLMVELLCSLLVGQTSPSTGHFMGAIRLSSFQPPDKAHEHMKNIFNEIRNLKKTPGRRRIFIPGELEAIAEKENQEMGIPISAPVMKQILLLKQQFKIDLDIEKGK